MSDPIVVVYIGCLECSGPFNLLGIYPDVATAQAAHPDAKLRSSFTHFLDWGGSDRRTVIFDVAGSDDDHVI